MSKFSRNSKGLSYSRILDCKLLIFSRDKNDAVLFLDLAIWEFSFLITQRVSTLHVFVLQRFS